MFQSCFVMVKMKKLNSVFDKTYSYLYAIQNKTSVMILVAHTNFSYMNSLRTLIVNTFSKSLKPYAIFHELKATGVKRDFVYKTIFKV